MNVLPTPPRPARALLYSHDSFGLGHLRRNLNIAKALTAARPDLDVLIVTGSPCATQFELPPRVEVVKLPSVSKDEEGRYTPRALSGELQLSIDLRRALLQQVFDLWAPDLLIVDHQLLGLRGELIPILAVARERGVKTVLGIRDVIDAPEVVAREWGVPDARWALAEVYDRVCVYGSPRVFDTRAEYPIPPELSTRLEFTGYLAPALDPADRSALPNLRPEVLVTMGGGEDGEERVHAYLDCLELAPFGWDSTLVLGPLMPSRAVRKLKRRARLLDGVRVHRFHADLPKLLQEADVAVGMAGYNTCAEILASGKPAVFLPRTFPRLEQHIRAERLARLGLARSLVAPTPAELRAAVEASLTTSIDLRPRPSLAGLDRLCEIVDELLARAGTRPTGAARGAGGPVRRVAQ